MLYELRVYETMPGKLAALNDRFAKHTIGFFEKHGIGMLGFWTDEIGTNQQMTYIISFQSMADRDARWSAFQADPGWQKARSETEIDGPFVSSIRNTLMRLTPYSPEPRINTNVQELRIYDAVPGKLPALHDRFAKHTTGLFQKHEMEVIAYWTDEVGTNNRLVYMLGYAGLGERETSWAAFQSDHEWQKVVAESHKDGWLVRQSYSTIMRRTDYSPR
jgi:hypothetical protein